MQTKQPPFPIRAGRQFLVAPRRPRAHNSPMDIASPAPAQLACAAAAGLLLLAGATLDLLLVLRLQRGPPGRRGPALDELRNRPFAPPHAALALSTTLLFAVPALFQASSPATPSESALIGGPLFYACGSLLVVAACLFVQRSSFRQAFLSPTCGVRRALGCGLAYGLAALPAVLLLSCAMSAATEALGYEPQPQAVFDWLGDGGVSTGTRIFMMAAALTLAPVAEELLFRGILFPALLKGRPYAMAALLTSLYFALVHFHAPSLLPLTALGLAFAAGYAATGSILTPIVMHALFNGTSLLLYFAERA